MGRKIHERIRRIRRSEKAGVKYMQRWEDLVEDVSVIEPVYRTAERFAPNYDPDAVFEQITGYSVKDCGEKI